MRATARTPDAAGEMRRDAALVRHRVLLPVALLRLAPDPHLIEQVQAGSQRAFEVIFDRHHRSVLAFCRHMVGSREDAEDAVQQTFMAAYRDLVGAEKPVVLRPWLYAIARHRCLSLLRARRERPLEEVPQPVTDHFATEVAARQDLRAIVTDMARLPDDQRAALVLAELGDLSHEQIARVIGCPRDKVKALVFQARSSLASSRAARDTPCDEIREQLATLRGGALRRPTLRRHLHDCPGCRTFREKVAIQRRELALLIPVIPTVGLKQAVLSAVFGAGGGAGGATVTAGGLGGGLFVTALVAIAIPAGGVGTAVTRSHDEANAGQTKTLGSRAAAAAARPRARATAALGPAPAGNAGRQRSPERLSADVATKAGPQDRERPAPAQTTSNDSRPDPHATNHDQPERATATSPPQAEPAESPKSGDPPKSPKHNAPIKPAKPAWPANRPPTNGETTPPESPKAYGHDAPTKVADLVKPPPADGGVTPTKPERQDAKPPTVTPGANPAPPANAEPSPPVAVALSGSGNTAPNGNARDRTSSYSGQASWEVP
ncbi:MAG TPA: sigma-70 family RNA polymerase sigma factor [Solirubrobacteraceae bacterium]